MKDHLNWRIAAAAFLVCFSPAAVAGVSVGDFPDDSSWYFHADFKEMRRGGAGRDLHDWLDREVFDDLRDELGIDLGKEADRVTAYSANDDEVVFVMEGPIEQESKDKITALAATADTFDSFTHKGKAYYFVNGEAESKSGDAEIQIDDGAYFSFAIRNKFIAASTEGQLKELLDNGGRITGSKSHSGALFVLTAERSLVQAGVNADELAGRSNGDDDWDSNFLKNARQVALLVADAGGKIAIEARMEALDSEKAEALASIARGLIALQAFSDDIEPHVRDLLINTTVDVTDSVLELKLALDPKTLVATLDD